MPLPAPQAPLLFSEVAEQCPAGIVVILPDGKIQYTNHRAQQMMGLSADQYSARDYNAPAWRVSDFQGRLLQDDELIFSRILRQGVAINDAEHAVERADGTRIYLRISGQPMCDSEGRVTQVVFTMMDVSPAVLADRALIASEAKYRELVENLNEGIVKLGSDFDTIKFINPRMAQMLGYRMEELLGRSMWSLVPEDLRPALRERLKNRRHGVREQYDFQFLQKDGRRLYVNVAANPLCDEQGAVIGTAAAITDMSDRRKAELALRQSEQQFSSALEHAPIGMAIVALDGRFKNVNQALCQIVGYPKDELEQLDFQRITHPDDLAADLAYVEQLLEGRLGYYQMEKRYIRKSGGSIWIRLSVSLIRDASGVPLHFISQIEDIDESRRADERLRLSEARLRLMLDSVVDYEILMLDTQGFVTRSNTGALRLKGYTAQEMLQLHVSEFYLPDDVAAGRPALELKAAADSGRHEDEGWRRRKDGSRFWAQVVLTSLKDNNGVLCGFCKVTHDLTPRHQAEMELRAGKERLEKGLALLQTQNRQISALGELSNLLQSCLRLDEIGVPVRRYCRTLFEGCPGALYIRQPGEDRLEWVITWGDSLATKSAFEVDECWALRRGQLHACSSNDDSRCTHLTSVDLPSSLCVPMMAQGEILGLLHLQPAFADEAATSDEDRAQTLKLALMVADRIGTAIANIRLRERLRAQSIRDPLTRLYNRRFLEEAFPRELAEVKRSGEPLALLMLDIDHFKHCNDLHGHDAGDVVLQAVSKVLQTQCRESDVICRFGGEEFVVLMPRTSEEQALRRAEALRLAVAAADVMHRDRRLERVTLSIGLATVPRNGDHMAAVMHAADQALYQAKRAGRDRVVTAV